MDAKARLDYALFQLTPTRTRCDLMVFSGRITEKLASGLFDPFVSHLKSLKDEISKGGYSIKLCPPAHAAPWFTKGTVERFVRFVSTPALLERFVSIEREILQIDSSVQANELSNTHVHGQLVEGSVLAANVHTKKRPDSPKLKSEVEHTDDDVKEENSRIHLQRLLVTRKTFLRKEQAMAYVCGIVAGFEMDNIDDLISFAGAFGALRLREACINFKDLCKKKDADGLWMEELTAMQACSPPELSFVEASGIVLTNEISAHNQRAVLDSSKGSVSTIKGVPNESLDTSKSGSSTSQASLHSKKDNTLPSDQIPSSTAKLQLPMPWTTQIPPYIYNFQIPIQQIPPHQGYPFPTMQSVPHNANNMQWPRPNYHRNQKSYSVGSKKNFPNKKEVVYSEEDRQTESSDSDSGSDSDSNLPQDRQNSLMEHSYKKECKKKSSRTVFIRNINYIRPKSTDGDRGGVPVETSADEELIYGDSLKQEIEDSIGSSKKIHNSNSRNEKTRGLDKSCHNLNQSSDAADQDLLSDLITDSSKVERRNESWDSFQNLLMKNDETHTRGMEKLHLINVQNEHCTVPNSEDEMSISFKPVVEKAPNWLTAAADSFVATERMSESDGRVELEDFENSKNFHHVIKRRDSADEELVIPQRLEESGTGLGITLSNCSAERTIIKTGRTEDWFIINHSGMPENQDVNIQRMVLDEDCIVSLEGDCPHTEKSRIGTLTDDSFMIETRSAVDDLYDSQWKTDICMETDMTLAAHSENGTPDISQVKYEVSNAYDPDDLCVVFERDSRVDFAEFSLSMNYGIDISLTEANGKCSGAGTSEHVDQKLPLNCKSTSVNNSGATGTKYPSKEARSKVLGGALGKSKYQIMSKSKKPSPVSRPIVQNSKLEKEEEIRKKMEDMLIQRQKRIAEKTAAGHFAPTTSKKVVSQSKTMKSSFKSEKIISTTSNTNRIGSVKISAT
ncbi:hypothetical protein F2P56_006257 [Juglans regia]|uniref:COP1-interacting protein 7 n=2 Tax=Juglans regia TaxID=51240 RepID=A0A833Y006_JUGRE|nr:COP1-interacting protein 7 [Juglans regia]KAF5474352.1 hypothetical protein F2P56_006257 [Juglans regia]